METTIARQLPAIADLYNEAEIETLSERAQLAFLLNQPPAPSWVKEHPNIAGYKYLPIERVEYLLSRIFIKWRVEVKEVKLIANSCQVTVRLHVLDPITGEWDWQDGVGASPLQTDKGKGAIEFNYLKNSAVMMAAPAAETFAVKDAAEKFGKIFGKDLNRKDVVAYDALLNTFEGPLGIRAAKSAVEKLLKECPDELLSQSVVEEIMEAERERVATIDFYQRMISKLSTNGNH